MIVTWPLPNVWLGVSVEDQTTADQRIPLLLDTPAAVRFVSYEPALGPVTLTNMGTDGTAIAGLNALTGEQPCCHDHPDKIVYHNGLDWIIAGGESGGGARPSRAEWFRKVREQCEIAGVPFFFKQWGEWIPVDQWRQTARFDSAKTFVGHTSENGVMLRVGKKNAGRRLDGREWNQFPAVKP